MVQYYADRAKEYDKIYEREDFKAAVPYLLSVLRNIFVDRTVLEVACGTGFATKDIAKVAKSVLATDINEEVLEIAKVKLECAENVGFLRDDAFKLDRVSGNFDSGYAGFLWSHIEKRRRSEFLTAFHSKIRPGGLVVLCDSLPVMSAFRWPFTRTDDDGNTYQTRRLENGDKYEVLKNLTTREEFSETIEGLGADLEWQEIEFIWCASYRLPN